MEPEVIDFERAALAWAILTVIPVVIFAIWADGFGRYIKDQFIKRPQFDKEIEIEKVRTASLFVILFQFTLFLGSSEVRHAFPMFSQITFFLGVSSQLILQYLTERKIRPADQEIVKLVTRALISWLLGGVLYLAILIGSIKVASICAEKLHANPNLSALLILAGGISGIIIGLGINFALGPFHLKKILPTSLIIDQRLKKSLELCFTRANLKIPNILIIELTRLRVANMIFTGFQKGKGWIYPTLFISRSLLDSLSHREVETVTFGHISHVALKHLRKRFLFSLALILGTTLTSIAAVWISKVIFSPQIAFEVIGPAVALSSFFVSFKLLTQQSRNQELEADLYSIEKLGVGFDEFSQALRKLDAQEVTNPSSMLKGFPETERRILAIQSYLEKNKGQQSLSRSKAS